MEPTNIERNRKYIKAMENDESIVQDLRNVTQIEDGILQYVRRQMGCETVTRQVMREAVAFEREMRSMNREMSIIEEQLMSEAGFEEEEAFGSRW